MSIRIITLSIMTPWVKELEDVDELYEHLHRIGYIRPHLRDMDQMVAADGVSMEAADDGPMYVIRQQAPDGIRSHCIEFPAEGYDAFDFEQHCRAWGIISTGSAA